MPCCGRCWRCCFMIVALDQLLWRPIVVWAQKFRVEEGGEAAGHDVVVLKLAATFAIVALDTANSVASFSQGSPRRSRWTKNRLNQRRLQMAATGEQRCRLPRSRSYCCCLAFGAWKLTKLLAEVPAKDWGDTFVAAIVTLVRVLVSTAIGTLWALPAGLAIGLSPRLSRIFQPVVQVAASFPAPMLFPLVIAVLGIGGHFAGLGLHRAHALGHAMVHSVQCDRRSDGASLPICAKPRTVIDSTCGNDFGYLYFPAVFPYLVTGWVTAAGGAWNASIVAEYVTFKGQVIQASRAGRSNQRGHATMRIIHCWLPACW